MPDGAKIDESARALADIVNHHQFAPGEKLNIIGHSRGGDVALQAAWYVNHKIDNLITLDTPQYGAGNFEVDMSDIGKWLDVYVYPDLVAPIDSNIDGGLNFRPTYHLDLSCWLCGWFSPTVAHSASWSNDGVRQAWWSFWLDHSTCQEWWDPKSDTLHGCNP